MMSGNTGKIDTIDATTRTRPRGKRLIEEERIRTQDAFIKALGNTANVRAACLQANISYTTIYKWQEHDEEFSLRFKQANKDANWLLFGEAWQRAMKGEKRYVVAQGRVVLGEDDQPLTYQEKSDRMLELLLKARLPEFREKQHITVETLPKEYNFDPAQDGVDK